MVVHKKHYLQLKHGNGLYSALVMRRVDLRTAGTIARRAHATLALQAVSPL